MSVNNCGQSVWELQTVVLRGNSSTAGNSGFKKLAVQWLNEAFPLKRDKLCYVSGSELADSLLFRIRYLNQATVHYQQL